MVIAQRVTGEEEVPGGAVAVLTPDAPDVLSHVSVRARNMRVLFAICHDPEELAKVRRCTLHSAAWLLHVQQLMVASTLLRRASIAQGMRQGPYSISTVDQVSELSGKGVDISVTAAGGVEWGESDLSGAHQHDPSFWRMTSGPMRSA